jgi:hypothetical protein
MVSRISIYSLRLQSFLESMKELQQFHVYTKINNNNIDKNFILMNFGMNINGHLECIKIIYLHYHFILIIFMNFQMIIFNRIIDCGTKLNPLN